MNIFEEIYSGILEAKRAYAAATNTAEQDAARNLYEKAAEKIDDLNGAVEAAWLFQKAGCSLAGLLEINSQYKDLVSNEYEKIPAYLFIVK